MPQYAIGEHTSELGGNAILCKKNVFKIEIVVGWRGLETFCNILAASVARAKCGLPQFIHIILHFTCHCLNLLSVSYFHTNHPLCIAFLIQRQFNADLSRFTFTTLKARHHRRLLEWQKSKLLFYSKHIHKIHNSSTSMCISIYCTNRAQSFLRVKYCHFWEETHTPLLPHLSLE